MVSKHISTGLLGLLVSTPCLAEEDVAGANVLGMGGVSVAAMNDNSAITANPGMMALTSRYDFHGHFKIGPTGGAHWGASAMDGQTSKFLWLGVAYGGDTYSPELQTSELPGWTIPGEEISNKKRFHDLTLGLSVPIISERLAIGLNGGVSIFNHDRQGRGVTGNGDLGVGFLATKWLSVGVVGENLLPIDGDRTLGGSGGVRVFSPTVGAFEIDGGYHHGPSDGITLGVGGEKNAGIARLRLGYDIDLESTAQRVSWGLGLIGEGGSFEYGMALPISPGQLTAAGLVNQLSIHLKAPDTSDR